MTRKSGDAKKLIVANRATDYQYPTESDWKRFQEILGYELPKDLRDQITAATMMLAMGGWSSKKTLTTSRLIKELQLWQARTKIIRRKICGRDSTRRAIVSRSDIIKTFFSQPRPDLIGLFRVTELFVFAVDAALACSDALIREVSGPRFPGDAAPALWSAWVALIMKFMAKHGFSVQQVRGSNRVIDSRFVNFIAALQKTLPLGEQRRRKTQSLKRGIQDVLLLSNSTSFETLLFMMCIWGAAGADRLRALHISSKTDFGKEIAAFLAPFEKRLTRRKNQQKAGNGLAEKIA